MAFFIDTKGESWNIDFTIADFHRIDDQFAAYNAQQTDEERKIYLSDHTGTITRLNDLYFFTDLLYFALEPIATKRGIDAREFGSRLAGSVIDDARTAFQEAYVDFFSPTIQPSLLSLIRTTNEIRLRTETELIQTRASENPELIAEAVRERLAKSLNQRLDAVRKGSGVTSGNLPESSESSIQNR